MSESKPMVIHLRWLVLLGLILLLGFMLVNALIIHKATGAEEGADFLLLMFVMDVGISICKLLVLALILFQISILFEAGIHFRDCFLACLAGGLVLALVSLGISVYATIFSGPEMAVAGASALPDLSLAGMFGISSRKLGRILRVFSLAEGLWWAVMYQFLRGYLSLPKAKAAYLVACLGGLTLGLKVVYRIAAS